VIWLAADRGTAFTVDVVTPVIEKGMKGIN
jgi:hypothetical protein